MVLCYSDCFAVTVSYYRIDLGVGAIEVSQLLNKCPLYGVLIKSKRFDIELQFFILGYFVVKVEGSGSLNILSVKWKDYSTKERYFSSDRCDSKLEIQLADWVELNPQSAYIIVDFCIFSTIGLYCFFVDKMVVYFGWFDELAIYVKVQAEAIIETRQNVSRVSN